MAEQDRNTLKDFFKKGKKPTEQNYADFIDSFVNKNDDNFVETIPALPDATTTKKGIVEQATLAEVEAGLDNTRFITPKGAKRAVETFTSESIKKNTKLFNINDLKTTDVYEILPAQGANKIISVHKTIFDINITVPYNNNATNYLLELDVNSEYFVGNSNFMDINIENRKVSISVASGGNFSTSILDKPLNLKPKINESGGTLIVKVVVFYSVIDLS
ncbi:hypothetical protein JL193_07190 [Polaribacter batillariae]|uniref:Uncharacterized protein n=1 Tax=Polaribacter batillariae TaxID=2808900 RepID=A0ABX7SXU7_9FLAO|nr:hypothetical protein [Polaribacter batillariae]QTD39026.1 hypothetical protein JL193_07190 [Polaribacter batillariae]